MDISNLINLISSKYHSEYVNETKRDAVKLKIEKMSPLLRKSLEEVLQEKEVPEINLLGYTVEKLKTNHGMNEVAAYLTLDWILREPKEALETLEKGYDSVNMSV